MGIKHSKTSNIQSTADPSLVGPADWNADHLIQGTVDFTGANVIGLPTNTLNSPVQGPNPVAFDVDVRFKGPNPYSDVTRYGVRAISAGTPGAPGITGSINSGSNSLTVSTSTCATQTNSVCFVNGDGITIYGAGAPHNLATPVAPAVVPSLAQAGTGTGFTVAGPTGATPYQYQVVARDKAGGLTAASTITAIVTGQASLGSQSVSIASISRSNNVVTVVTSSAHTLVTGAQIMITSNDGTWAGTYQVSGSADSTHFTYASSQDTRNGAPASPIVLPFTGTIFWMNCNHITWTAVTGAWQYYIYGRTSGNMVLLGVTHPSASGDTDTIFDDFGATMMTSSTLGIPSYVPNSPPGSATSDNLVTTITSGAGTTTLILANAAGTTVSGVTVLLDNAPKLVAAAQAAQNLYFPLLSSGLSYVTNSIADIAAAVGNQSAWMYSGGLSLNETLILKGSLVGDMPNYVVGNANNSFTFVGDPVINTNSNPGVYFPVGTVAFVDRIAFVGGQNPVFIDSNNETPATPQFGHHVAFQTLGPGGNGTSDYMGIALYWREANGIRLGRVNVSTGPGTQGGGFTGSTFTPSVYFRNCGNYSIDAIFMQDRGMMFQPGTVNSSLRINWGYTQGGITPFVTVLGPISAAQTFSSIEIQHFIDDTTSQPQLSYLPTSGFGVLAQVSLGYIDTPPGGNVPLITGPTTNWAVLGQTTSPGVSSTSIPGASYTNTSFTNFGNALDSIFANNLNAGPGLYAVQQNSAAISASPGYPIFIDSTALPAPTCSVSAGGTWAVGSYTFKVTPIWQNHAAGEATPPSIACVTTNGNQTMTLTAPTFIGNMLGVNFYTSLNGGTYGLVAKNGSNDCTTSPQMTTSGGNVVLSGSGSCGSSTMPTVPAGGPTMLMPGVQGIASGGPIVVVVSTFLNLGTVPGAGTFKYCTDCTTAATCAGSGSGHMAVSNGTNWTCA